MSAEFSGTFLTSLVSTFLSELSMLPKSPYPQQNMNRFVAGRHTLLQPVKLSTTMTASPASLTGSERFRHWLVVFWLPRSVELIGSGLRK